MNDAVLLAGYVNRRSEEAFRQIVDGYWPKVYAICLRRMGGNVAEAEEACQSVFIILTQQAHKIRIKKGKRLSCWFFKTSRYVTAHMFRAKARREKHEREAAKMIITEDVKADWQKAKYLLDGIIDTLSGKQRDAIIMHYLDGMTYKQVAETIGSEESTIRMRCKAGVEKLRAKFVRRGIVFSSTVLFGCLTTELAEAAPAGLADSIHTAAMAGVTGTGGTSSAMLTAKGAMKMMMWTKIKMVASLVLISASIGTGATVIGGNLMKGRSRGILSIESKSVRRTVSVKDGRLKTVEIKNLLNGKRHKVLEDGFHIIWIPDGDYKKGKRIRFDEKNMKVSGKPAVKEVEFSDVGLRGVEVKKKKTELRIPLASEEHPVKVDVVFTASKAELVIRKHLEVSAPAGSMVLDAEVDRIKLDWKNMKINAFDKVVPIPGNNAGGGQMFDMRCSPGYPVYTGNLFLGLEFMGGYNLVDKKSVVTLRHYPGKLLQKGGTWQSKDAVLGAASGRPNDRVEDAFLRYIDGIAYYKKVHGNRAFLLDMPKVRSDCIRRKVTFSCGGPKHMFSAPLKFNEEVARENKELDKAGKPPYILFFSTGSGGSCEPLSDEYKSFRKPDNKAGFEYAGRCGFGEWFCAAGPNYGKSSCVFLEKLIKEHNISILHLDYLTLGCKKEGHGHLPVQPYAREACYDGALQQIAAVHKGNPECTTLLNGLWNDVRSPWWVMEAEAVMVGMGHYPNASYNPWFISCGGLNSGYPHTTTQDRYFFDRYVLPGRHFPLWTLSEVGHNARYRLSLEEDASFEEVWEQAAKMLFEIGRSHNQWLVKMSRWSKGWKDLHVPIYKWGVANEEVLMAACKPFGGPPRLRKPYGYSHCLEDSNIGFIFIRNPFAEPKVMNVTLGEELGLDPQKGSYTFLRIFPFRELVKLNARAGSKIKLYLEGYEAGVFKVIKEKELQDIAFTNCRYDLIKKEGSTLIYDLYPHGQGAVKTAGLKCKVTSVEGGDVRNGSITPAQALQAIPKPSGNFTHTLRETAIILSGRARVEIPEGVKAQLLILSQPGIDLMDWDAFHSNQWGFRVMKKIYEVTHMRKGLKREAWCKAEVKSAGKPLNVKVKYGYRDDAPSNGEYALLWQWHIADIPAGVHDLDLRITTDTGVEQLDSARFSIFLRMVQRQKPVKVKVLLTGGAKIEEKDELEEFFPGCRVKTFVLYDDTKQGEVPVRLPKYPVKRVIPKHLRGVIAPDLEEQDMKPVKE